MIDQRTLAVAFVTLLLGAAVGAGTVSMARSPPETSDPVPSADGPHSAPDGPVAVDPGNDSDRDRMADAGVERFESERAFRRYVQRNRPSRGRYLFGGPRVALTADAGRAAANEARDDAGGDGGGGGDDGRISDTNVQEPGIDEPDLLKTDGSVVFYAGGGRGRYRTPADTRIVDVSDAADPEFVGEVPASGELLLVDDVLVVETGEALVGYDVSDPADPDRVWRTELNDTVVTARLLDGRIYVVTRSGIDPADPCPVRPFGEDGPAIGCTEVYHPTRPARADATYTTSVIDPETGAVTDAVSVVGSSNHEATYVSENAVYLTYSRRASYFELFSTYLLENRTDVVDDRLERRVRELRGMNISDRAKAVELRTVLHRFYARLPEDRRSQVRENVTEGFEAYRVANRRSAVRTGIVKVGIGDGLSIAAAGEVPGYPLNQFSMDERDGHLRIATTVWRRWGGRPTNDLYVLDESLGIVGAETGMADNERIFSVRFVGDTAYLVTFRRIDPFHVVDLSDPAAPEELGNVELPGFSRYLHPIGEDRILGVGEEDGRVKAVVFDVSNPSNPTVQDSLVLDDRWSAVSETHHAFLQDERHGVFFLPGSRGGYVIDYTGDRLRVQKRVETVGPATRAMYHDDYLYVFDRDGMVVVDETDWDTVDRVDFDRPRDRSKRRVDSPPARPSPQDGSGNTTARVRGRPVATS